MLIFCSVILYLLNSKFTENFETETSMQSMMVNPSTATSTPSYSAQLIVSPIAPSAASYVEPRSEPLYPPKIQNTIDILNQDFNIVPNVQISSDVLLSEEPMKLKVEVNSLMYTFKFNENDLVWKNLFENIKKAYKKKQIINGSYNNMMLYYRALFERMKDDIYKECYRNVHMKKLISLFRPNKDTYNLILGEGGSVTTAIDRKSTRLNSSHMSESRMPSSA